MVTYIKIAYHRDGVAVTTKKILTSEPHTLIETDLKVTYQDKLEQCYEFSSTSIKHMIVIIPNETSKIR